MSIEFNCHIYRGKELKKEKAILESSEKIITSFREMQNTEFIFKKIKNLIKKADIEIKPVSKESVQRIYKNVDSIVCNTNNRIKITISPKVIYKMQEDKAYAYKILAAISKSYNVRKLDDLELKLSEFHIFIKDDGEIETVSCGESEYKLFMRKRQELIRINSLKKARLRREINEVKSRIYSHYKYLNNKYEVIARKFNVKNKYVPYEYLLSQNSELKRLKEELYF